MLACTVCVIFKLKICSVPVSTVQRAGLMQLLVLVQLVVLQAGLVRPRDPRHGHTGTVDEEDEDRQEADHGAYHAETDDASTAQV